MFKNKTVKNIDKAIKICDKSFNDASIKFEREFKEIQKDPHMAMPILKERKNELKNLENELKRSHGFRARVLYQEIMKKREEYDKLDNLV